MIPFVILAIEDDEDRAFMTEVYLQYERLMWSEIRKCLRDEQESEDAFQEALVKLVRHVKKLRSLETRNLVNYIITTVKHTCFDVLRRKKKASSLSMDDKEWIGQYSLQSDENVEDTVYRREAVAELEAIWPQLDERSRYLLESRYFLGMSTYEMGEILNITHDSVRVELSRARRKAKKLMEEQRSRAGA